MHRQRFILKLCLLLAIALLPLSGQAEDAPYQLQVEANSDSLQLHWDIDDDIYLYQEKIKLSLEQADGVSLGDIDLPPAVIKQNVFRPDGTTGDIAVYYKELDLTIPLLRTTRAATTITLKVSYQGCADEGICYPPVNQQIELALPATDGTAATSPKSEQDRIAATLDRGNIWSILALFFGAGLLLALTPCIFPMIPILSGIIVGHGAELNPKKGFLLSLLYVTAMAFTYALVGVVAGLFGYNIQADLQNPWLLSTFALLFVLLALSMFGLYKLQLPSSWQSRITQLSNSQQGGNWAGVAIMGALSALIVGPCVAPPFAGAMIYIAQSRDAILGGAAFFTLGIGMGVPLLLIGASAGKLLPKAGDWMDTINVIFGILLLGVAIILLERILPALVSMLLWGALLIGTAIYLLKPRNQTAGGGIGSYLRRALGLALLLYGGSILIGAATGSRDIFQPLQKVDFLSTSTPQQHLTFKQIKTLEDLQREVAAAKAVGKPVMLDFYADWCISCKELERYTFSDPAVVAALQTSVLLQADVTANDQSDRDLLNHFEISGPPLIVFYDMDGREQRHRRLVGFIDATEFLARIREANSE